MVRIVCISHFSNNVCVAVNYLSMNMSVLVKGCHGKLLRKRLLMYEVFLYHMTSLQQLTVF